MGCRESSKVTKTARLRAPTQERATCSPGRARAGSVPTASPGPQLALAGSIHKLTIRRWAPFPGRTPRPLPARWLPRSQRQRSLMIKHRRWAPPASFASTASWLCLIITTARKREGSPCTRHPCKHVAGVLFPSPHSYPLSVYYYHSYFTNEKIQEQKS